MSSPFLQEFFIVWVFRTLVYIGTDLSDEYTNSNYTHRLKGTSAKAKANAVFALPVYDIKGKRDRYNVFIGVMVMRCSQES